ncbi:MAG: GNAT superfamily N-acetyltransferase, partial [bacterium]
MKTQFKIAQTEQDFYIAKQFILDYAQFLGMDLSFQNFEKEIQDLPTMYSPPDGVMLIAYQSEKLAGGVGLRKIDSQICEMKRLYVYPEQQGKGVGKLLITEFIIWAKKLGYKKIRLDTIER